MSRDVYSLDTQLPHDRFSPSDCEVLAKIISEQFGGLVFVSDICRICGELIQVMAYRGTGACCVDHHKMRTGEMVLVLDTDEGTA